jgi:hypothetical protein
MKTLDNITLPSWKTPGGLQTKQLSSMLMMHSLTHIYALSGINEAPYIYVGIYVAAESYVLNHAQSTLEL